MPLHHKVGVGVGREVGRGWKGRWGKGVIGKAGRRYCSGCGREDGEEDLYLEKVVL